MAKDSEQSDSGGGAQVVEVTWEITRRVVRLCLDNDNRLKPFVGELVDGRREEDVDLDGAVALYFADRKDMYVVEAQGGPPEVYEGTKRYNCGPTYFASCCEMGSAADLIARFPAIASALSHLVGTEGGRHLVLIPMEEGPDLCIPCCAEDRLFPAPRADTSDEEQGTDEDGTGGGGLGGYRN